MSEPSTQPDRSPFACWFCKKYVSLSHLIDPLATWLEWSDSLMWIDLCLARFSLLNLKSFVLGPQRANTSS
jgi:hypothetical protein